MKIKIISLCIACVTAFGLQAQIDRSVMPESGPAPEINLQIPNSFEMDNGLEVLVVEDHTLPKATARMIIDNKPHFESKPGTSALLSRMLGTGTEKIGKDEYIEEIDFLGATVNFGSSSAYATSLSKYFPRIFELMAAGAIHPKFAQEEFDAQKAKLIQALKNDDKNVPAIASRISDVLAYGKKHPYGQFATEETVEKITLDDVVSYYNNYYVPENAYLVVIGDVSKSDVKDLVKEYWKEWKASTPPSASLPAVTPAQYTQIDFVNMPNAVQSVLRIQNTVDLQMADEDYFAVLVANQILGGGFGGYLNMNLREEHGFTYGAFSNIGTDKFGSKFMAYSKVRNAVTDSAVVQAMKEINRIYTEKVSSEDLKRAKSKFAGNFVLRLEDPSTVANFALNIKTKGLDDDFYKNYLKNINAVTAEDVMRVTQKYIKPEHMRIIVAGKGSDVAEELENLTLLNGKTPPVLYFDKLGNRVEKPIFEKPIPEGVTAQTVFSDYIAAIGGKDAVEDIESVVINASAKMGGMTIGFVTKRTDIKSMQQISMGGNVVQKTVFDGENGYIMAKGQKIPMTAEQIKENKTTANLFPELSATNAKLKKITTVDGQDAYAVEFDSGTVRYYDTETNYKIAEKTVKEMGPNKITVWTYFDNYQPVGDVKFAFSMKQLMGPREIEMVVSDIKVNEGVSDADFE